MEDLLIISGMFPPMHGGLPDHTDRLAHELSKAHRVTVLTSTGVETDRPFAVRSEVEDWHDGARLLERVRGLSGVGPVLWQYVPHMYGRGGVNFAVPAVMAGVAREGRRQVVLAHEIRAPFSLWPHRTLYALAHRMMWWRVRRVADAIGISTSVWLDQFRAQGWESAKGRLFLAPSPSNIPVRKVEPGHALAWRAAQGLEGASRVLGFFGSVGTGKQFDWVLAAWREARRRERATGLVVMGGRPEPVLNGDERRWFRALGYLGGVDASEALQATDLLALPFEDGVSERRSSFMVGLAHGMAVVTTVGDGTSRELGGGDFFRGVAVSAGRGEFGRVVVECLGDDALRRELGERAVRRYASRYDWGSLASAVTWQLGGGGGDGGEHRARV